MGGGWAYIRRAGGLGHSIPEGSRGQITGAEFFNAAELFERRHDRHARRDTDALFAVAAPTFRHLRLRFTPAALGVGAGGGGGRGVAWWQPSPTSSSLAEVVGVQCASVRATRPTSGGKSVQLSASHRVLTNRGRTGRNRRQETPSPEEASTQGREQKQSEVWANKSRPGVKRKHGESVIRGVVDDEKQGTSAIIPI
ncbi:hypothetical protein AXG93_2415s1470 [Marchantia polymorpha subsp. ruderalis]|uniref:Uncharacterized protein n=1 Tax=Marchantia polymorpha subsp. ruderalis TaxID=1480154 RepID=A0A176VWN9_MARPO|nr:hypothetical protein AXG93_2415s1470 [Marchantia polymorpha subsp. ruderalis]